MEYTYIYNYIFCIKHCDINLTPFTYKMSKILQQLPKWHYLGYNLPENCYLLELKHAKIVNRTRHLCKDEIKLLNKLNITLGNKTVGKVTHCEVSLHYHHSEIEEYCSKETMFKNPKPCRRALNKAEECKRWSIFDWILTSNPGIFGIVGGSANITGVFLIIILTIMVLCSLPFVRKSGNFQVDLQYTFRALEIKFYEQLFNFAPQ